MPNMTDLKQRWETLQATKTQVFWACAGCIAATILIGFTWGGWVTGGTASEMAADAAANARTQLAADICVERFAKGADAAAQLAALQKSDSWTRDTFIEKGGWATLAGMKEPVDGAAELCAERILKKQDQKTS